MQKLTAEQGELLLQIARQRIAGLLNGNPHFDLTPYQPEKWLWEQGAVFVTLTIDGELRGCIGSLEACRPLINDVLNHAYNAAFNDYRFNPLTQAEFVRTKIEISVLTPRRQLDYSNAADLKAKLCPGVDGVYLTVGTKGATFLPQVWEDLPNFDLFFRHLCMKAGVSADCITDGRAKIEIYQVQKFE